MNARLNFSRTTMNVRLANNDHRCNKADGSFTEPVKLENSQTQSQMSKEWNLKNKTDSTHPKQSG